MYRYNRPLLLRTNYFSTLNIFSRDVEFSKNKTRLNLYFQSRPFKQLSAFPNSDLILHPSLSLWTLCSHTQLFLIASSHLLPHRCFQDNHAAKNAPPATYAYKTQPITLPTAAPKAAFAQQGLKTSRTVQGGPSARPKGCRTQSDACLARPASCVRRRAWPVWRQLSKSSARPVTSVSARSRVSPRRSL